MSWHRDGRGGWRALVAGLVLFGSGCTREAEAVPQWRVVLGTDAPVPQLGDRVLVQILVPNDEGTLTPCKDCQRQLAGNGDDVWPISFGVAKPEAADEVWMRARLYRSIDIDELGLPRTNIVVDLLARLPELSSGVLDVAGVLRGDCIGQPASIEERSTCDPVSATRTSDYLLPTLGDVTLPLPGTWPPSQPVDCAGSPPGEGMICVPGGLLIQGSTEFLPVYDGELRPLPERLVRLSPFWMDGDEVTVAGLKGLIDSHGLAPPMSSEQNPLCTYSAGATADDALPVNCIGWADAQQACAVQDKRLPTEAQWEYAASNVGRETPFPFDVVVVDTATLCNNAVFAAAPDSLVGSVACVSFTGAGLRPGGSERDVNELGIRNLAGHVSEWQRDWLRAYDDPACFASALVTVDPLCDVPDMRRATRGGDWLTTPAISRSSTRNGITPSSAIPALGFRCVAPAEPAE
jgi:formylglycine-generating enzyme required for sulfatase activity